ncbi:hypothetical protein ACF0H5_003344 [Mactra antiquata]
MIGDGTKINRRKMSSTKKSVEITKRYRAHALHLRIAGEIREFLTREDNSRVLPGKGDGVKVGKKSVSFHFIDTTTFTRYSIEMTAFVWGFGKLGQLGNGETGTVHTPITPKLPPNMEVSDVQCGGYFTAVLTTDGRLFTFGCGKYGRLGTGNEADQKQPVEIRFLDGDKIEKVSCGIWHAAAVTTKKELYVWGYNKSHGVLGHKSIQSATQPCKLRGSFNNKIAGISCGNNFTLLWTDDGEGYSWGCGRHGVLGHGNNEDKIEPTIISYFKDNGIKVQFMNAGFAHGGVVSENGHVYMFGRNDEGALGLGKDGTNSVNSPKIVESLTDKNVKELSCSVGEKHGHTLFLFHNGLVYACGDGYKGKLGLGDQESRVSPEQIHENCFNNEQVIHVSAGGIHSSAVSSDGHVFTWGCGSDGRLGHPEGKGHRYLFRSDIPKLVEDINKHDKAVKISCSYYHTATVVIRGESCK